MEATNREFKLRSNLWLSSESAFILNLNLNLKLKLLITQQTNTDL